jgi:hypothetical protein
MTQKEANEYWFPARDNLVKLNIIKDDESITFLGSEELADILNISYPTHGFWQEFPLTKELKFKLEMLAGPYAHATIKILEIRKHHE